MPAPELSRRGLLASALALGAPQVIAAAAAADGGQGPARGVQRLATAWRLTGSGVSSAASPHGDQVGILEIHWDAGTLRLQAPVPVPSRGHGPVAPA